MKHTPKLLFLFAAVIGAVGLAATGWAFWTTGGSGSAAASVGTLTVPGQPAGTASPGVVSLSWNASTVSGGGQVKYHVERSADSGESWIDACNSTAVAPITGASCSESLGAGTYEYRVTAIYRSWTARSLPSADIVVNSAATKFAFTSSPVSGSAAGSATLGPITVQEQDASNDPVIAGTGGTVVNLHSNTTGTQTFSLTSGGAVITSVSIPSGQSSVSFYYGDTLAGTPTITASGSLTSATQQETITAGASNKFALAAVTTTPAAGAADNLTITAQDAYGNTATGYTGSKNLTFAGAATIASNNPTVTNSSATAINFGSTTAIGFTSGVSTSGGVMKLYKAETASVTVADGTINNGAGLSITVSPAPASQFSLATPATQTAGAPFSVSVIAKDQYQNTATGYAGSRTIVWSGAANAPSGTAPSFPASVTFTNGAGTASVTLFNAASTNLTATESSITGSTSSFTVNPAGAISFSMGNPGGQTAGSAFSVPVTAKDQWANVATGYTGSKTIVFTGPGNSPSGTAPIYPASVTFSNGTATATGIKLFNASASTTLTATETAITGTSTAFSVGAGSTAQFQVGNPGTLTANTAFSMTLNALDQWRNPSDYTGAHTIVWTGAANGPDGTAPTYPASATSLTFSGGTATATGIKLFNAASTTLTATESSITGTSTAFSLSAGTSAKLAWTNVTKDAGTLSSPCLFTCTDTGLGNQHNFTANVSVTDTNGNIVSDLGAGHSIAVSTPTSGAGSGGAFTAPAAGTSVSLTISATGPATSTATFTFKTQNGNWTSDTFSASTSAGATYATASATVTKN